MRRKLLVIALATDFLSSISLMGQTTLSTRLAALDKEYKVQALTNIQPVVDTAFASELGSGSGLIVVNELKHHIAANYLSRYDPTSPITSESIANAFNDWIRTIGGSVDLYVKPSDVTAHRIFLSHFAHNLIPRASNSAVHHDLSAAEALYLIDRMISQGGCPRIEPQDRASGRYFYDSSKDHAVVDYRMALTTYYAHNSEAQQVANFRAILIRAHLL